MFSFSRTPTPEEKVTIIRVSEQYLTLLLRGDDRPLNSLVIWPEFLADRGEVLTKEQVLTEAKTLATRWPVEDHPLVALDVLDLTVQGNEAEVIMQRTKRPDLPKITINLYWVGRAWMVQHDSIFGVDGLIAQHPASQNPSV